MAFGVTDSGFIIKPLETILAEMEEAQRQRISPTINTTAESPLGQVNGIIASLSRELWEVAEADYNSGSILTATGQALDRLVALSTLTRAPASKSSVIATVNLNAGVTLPAGSQANVDGNTDAVFETVVPVTNGGGVPADFNVQMTGVSTGPVRANAGTLIDIFTPVAGWNTVTNAEDAALGSEVESDSALRARYMRTAGGKGLRTFESIIQAVGLVNNVSTVLVYENPLDVIDPLTNITPHSIEVVIDDGGLAIANDVAQAIWDVKAAGIGTYGSVAGNAIDAIGGSHVVSFSHVQVLDVHLQFYIRVNGSFSTTEGTAGLKTAVAEWGDANLIVGETVILSALSQPVFDFGGVEDIVFTFVSTDGVVWQNVNLTLLPKQRADLDTGRIIINIL